MDLDEFDRQRIYQFLGIGVLVVALFFSIVMLMRGGKPGPGVFPESGSVTVSKRLLGSQPKSQLRIISGQQNVVVQLFDASDRKLALTVYVRALTIQEVPIPAGIYKVRIVQGTRWKSYRWLFYDSMALSLPGVVKFTPTSGHELHAGDWVSTKPSDAAILPSESAQIYS